MDRQRPHTTEIYDFNAVEKVCRSGAVRGFSQGKPTAEVRALKSEILYRTVTRNAEALGMRVNAKKTQMLCIAPVEENVITSTIRTEDGKIITSGNRTNIEGVENLVKNLFSEPWIHFLKVHFD